MLSLPTRNERIGAYKFLKIVVEWSGKNNQKIFSKKLARLKKSCTFAPANRMRGENKKEWHVHRHIELTAQNYSDVILKIRESKIFRVNWKQPSDLNRIKQDRAIYQTIYDEEFDPGSGWTLAAGLTHASRGVEGACSFETGARVRNAYAIYLVQGNSPEKFGLMPHSI